jgi:2-polyprenyl-3-methyl-5-hydroxy-6-metoxy-1,4-benzoquinol methylase
MKISVTCPICGGNAFENIITCEDFTVSREKFAIQQCRNCQLLLTNPQPANEELPRYYESEDYISHSNKSKGFINTLYKIARTYNLRWKVALIEKHITSKKILDYGCGTGHFLKECQKVGFQVDGVEPADSARRLAEETLGKKIYSDLSQVQDSFGIITLWHVLEHVNDLNEKVSELRRKLAKDGTLIIAVPNVNTWESKVYKTFWAAYDTPRHLWHFTQDTMGRLMHKHSLKVVEIHPMKLDAYYVSLLSEKYKNQNQLGLGSVLAAFITATRSNIHASKTTEYSSLIYVIKNAN